MNAPAIYGHVEEFEPLTQTPDQRRGDERSHCGDQEKGEICLQGRVTSRTKEESLVIGHLTSSICHLFRTSACITSSDPRTSLPPKMTNEKCQMTDDQ